MRLPGVRVFPDSRRVEAGFLGLPEAVGGAIRPQTVFFSDSVSDADVRWVYPNGVPGLGPST